MLPDLLHLPVSTPKEAMSWSDRHAEYDRRRRGPRDAEKDPLLQKRISLKGGTVEEVLAELSDRSGLPLLGEYDPCFKEPYMRTNESRVTLGSGQVANQPLWQAIETVAVLFDLEWSVERGWLWIRSPRTLLALSGALDLSPPKVQQ